MELVWWDPTHFVVGHMEKLSQVWHDSSILMTGQKRLNGQSEGMPSQPRRGWLLEPVPGVK